MLNIAFERTGFIPFVSRSILVVRMGNSKEQAIEENEPELREECLWCGDWNKGECNPCRADQAHLDSIKQEARE